MASQYENQDAIQTSKLTEQTTKKKRKGDIFSAIPRKIDTGLPTLICSSVLQKLQIFRYKSGAMKNEMNRFPSCFRHFVRNL